MRLHLSRGGLSLLCAFVLATSVAAQRTWIVDASNGPGTHFTDIPPAVAAAADGDTLLVRAGSYTGFSTGKALILIGEGNVLVRSAFLSLVPAIEVTGLAPSKSFVVANVTAELPRLGTAALRLGGNAGRIHLQNVRSVSPGSPAPEIPGCSIASCNEVTITGGSFTGYPGVFIVESTVAMSSVTVRGGDACGAAICASISGANGLVTSQSTVQLSRTDVRGGDGWFFPQQSPASAIRMLGGVLAITGDATTQIVAGGFAGALPLAAIDTIGGTLEVDTQVVLTGSGGGPGIGGTATVVRRRIVSLTGDGGPLGGTLSAELVSPSGDLFFLVAGFPGDPVAGPAGLLFLSPLVVVRLGFGVQGPAGRFAWSATVPNNTALRGGAIALQGANVYQATSRLEFSNPTVLVIE